MTYISHLGDCDGCCIAAEYKIERLESENAALKTRNKELEEWASINRDERLRFNLWMDQKIRAEKTEAENAALKAELERLNGNTNVLTQVNCSLRDELSFMKQEEYRLRGEIHQNYMAAEKAEARVASHHAFDAHVAKLSEIPGECPVCDAADGEPKDCVWPGCSDIPDHRGPSRKCAVHAKKEAP
jgi:chromosome segregation ATPase